MGYLANSLSELLARFIVLFTAITVHEYAHGFDFSNFRMIFDVIQEICAVRDDV